MSYIFQSADAFNQPIGNWNVSNVISMDQIFASSNFNQNISSWDVSKVENFNRAFAYNTAFNQPIGDWDISSATNLSGMFRGSNEQNKTIFNQDIGGWDTSNVLIASEMFAYATFNRDIGNWDTSSIRLFTAMFSYNPDFNQDIGAWDLSSMTDSNNLINGSNYGSPRNRMNGMFRNASSFNQNISGWCVTDITSEPEFFSINSSLDNSNKPVWGACPSSFSINVTASNSSNYTLSGTDRNGSVSGNDPSITLSLGDKITFNVDSPGHPFFLKTTAGTGSGNQVSGATNNGTSNSSVVWKPASTGTYYYQCSLHSGMVGTIVVQ